jgi:hypothetical protein
VITLPELVALLYQADWKRLSLLARISWARDQEADRQFRQRSESDLQRRTWTVVSRLTGMRDPDEPTPGSLQQESRVLLAPGGRFRVEAVADGTVAAVGDGERRWALIADRALRRPGEGPGDALHGLFTPQWLLSRYDLRVTGQAEVAGRLARQVTATPRRASRPLADSYDRLDRVDVLVDAALGIILRSEQVFGGRVLERAQLHDLEFEPPEAADAALFALPSHARDLDLAGDFEPSGPGWQAAGAAAGAAASAMGFAARHMPRKAARRTPGDAEPVMPADARRGPVPAADRSPAGADLANLLYRTGRPPPAFTAELHRWQDDEAYTDILQGYRGALPPWLDGILGPDALWDALAEHGPEERSEHQTARLRVAMPGRYRVDYRAGNWHLRYAAIACDGAQTRKIFADRVAVGPAVPLTIDIASLVDPAWLLSTWKLSAAGPARVAGRPGFRIVAEPIQGRSAAMGLSLVEVIVDAELGILLQHTSFTGDRPAIRTELRSVRPGGDRDAGFGADAASGLRVVTDSGGLLSDRDLPRPVQAAGAAAAIAGAGAAAGAVAVTGWLDRHRSRRRPGT